jgi:hypothetical protein
MYDVSANTVKRVVLKIEEIGPIGLCGRASGAVFGRV